MRAIGASCGCRVARSVDRHVHRFCTRDGRQRRTRALAGLLFVDCAAEVPLVAPRARQHHVLRTTNDSDTPRFVS